MGNNREDFIVSIFGAPSVERNKILMHITIGVCELSRYDIQGISWNRVYVAIFGPIKIKNDYSILLCLKNR